MPNFGMAEQYGIPCEDLSENTWRLRANKHCPFVDAPCNKKGGVCTISDGSIYAICCPRRFREDGLMFKVVSELAFAKKGDMFAIGEVAFLQPVNNSSGAVGSIDNLIVLKDEGEIEDWCGIEIQAVYFSGRSMGGEIKHFEQKHELQAPASRRPDFRSSATKRLLPQLEIKVPTLRRWGKKMFVVVDQPFFDWMPEMEQAEHISNADICWIVFDLDRSVSPYKLRLSKAVMTTLEDSKEGLIAGVAPTKPSFEEKIEEKMARNEEVLWSTT
ncbi:NotI family restriction endonuclease [Desulfovibrio inopinatus]|uniref:NotI family restriction endonuclease n=1 Tax=Desulfovibrio inopinatus TaxID=102109 RepID=UPI0003FD7305|nr:NotI family restriction endonuclease [Desulfovibrio inopinatus]